MSSILSLQTLSVLEVRALVCLCRMNYCSACVTDILPHNDLVKKDGKKLEKKEGAKVFLSQVWKQLGDLYFGKIGDYFEPLQDGDHPYQAWTYGAIGRLIAFSLLHGIQVPSHVLPPLLWVHLFRGKDYLETDNCFHNFAFKMRASEESNGQELCDSFAVMSIGAKEDSATFLERLHPVVLDLAKEQDRIYSSTRRLGWEMLKHGFEYPRGFFDSKRKYHEDSQEQISMSVRSCFANDPWTAVHSILGSDCMEEEEEEDYI